MAIGVKILTRRLPAGEVVMMRFVFGLIVLQALASVRAISISHRRLPLLIARGATGGLAIYLYFLSIEHTTLSKAALLGNAYPLSAAVFGAMLLGERIRFSGVAALAGSAYGAWLVIDPGPGPLVAGDLFGVAAAAFSGLAIVTIRELRQTETPFTVYWYLCIAGSAIGGLSCLSSFVVPSASDWAWIVAMGAASTIAQLLTTYGFRYCGAGEGAVMAMSTTAFSGLAGWFLMGERLRASGLAGATLILLCACYLSARQPARAAQ